MRQISGPQKPAAEQVIKDICRATRKHHCAEDKLRIDFSSLSNLQCLQPLGFRHLHGAEPGFPFICWAEAVLTAKLRDRRACLVMRQNADELFGCEKAALRSPVLSVD